MISGTALFDYHYTSIHFWLNCLSNSCRQIGSIRLCVRPSTFWLKFLYILVKVFGPSLFVNCCECPRNLCLTPNLHASLFNRSMLPRLHTFTSALTRSDQDFLGFPRPLEPGMAILLIELVHEVAHTTCQYHLRRLVLRATFACIPNFAYSFSIETSSVCVAIKQ